jgi:phage tail sheath protein FI
MMIEAALEKATQWAVFEPNNYYTRQTLILAAGSFLTSLWERGAFAGATPEESFFVRCDEDNNPQAAVDAGQLVIDIGVAPVKPAEFVIFRLGRVEDALELTEAKIG